MIVPTRAFLILLVPLLVLVAPHVNGSGNLPDTISTWSSKGFPTNIHGRAPVENDSDHRQHSPSPPPSDDSTVVLAASINAVDEHLHAIVLPPNCNYGMGRAIDIPIPADDYYRVPPMVNLEAPGHLQPHRLLDPYQVVRLRTAHILSRITLASRDDEVPILRIDRFLHGIILCKKNDKILDALVLPPESKWHGRPEDTVGHLIEPDKYTQLPPMVVVTTPVGTFSKSSGRVVRILPIDIPVKAKAP